MIRKHIATSEQVNVDVTYSKWQKSVFYTIFLLFGVTSWLELQSSLKKLLVYHFVFFVLQNILIIENELLSFFTVFTSFLGGFSSLRALSAITFSNSGVFSAT